MAEKKLKIDKVIELKAEVFDLVRKIEFLQAAMNEGVEIKNKKLKELQILEGDLKNRYTRAKKLVNK